MHGEAKEAELVSESTAARASMARLHCEQAAWADGAPQRQEAEKKHAALVAEADRIEAKAAAARDELQEAVTLQKQLLQRERELAAQGVALARDSSDADARAREAAAALAQAKATQEAAHRNCGRGCSG